jgi:hypothetical protein
MASEAQRALVADRIGHEGALRPDGAGGRRDDGDARGGLHVTGSEGSGVAYAVAGGLRGRWRLGRAVPPGSSASGQAGAARGRRWSSRPEPPGVVGGRAGRSRPGSSASRQGGAAGVDAVFHGMHGLLRPPFSDRATPASADARFAANHARLALLAALARGRRRARATAAATGVPRPAERGSGHRGRARNETPAACAGSAQRSRSPRSPAPTPEPLALGARPRGAAGARGRWAVCATLCIGPWPGPSSPWRNVPSPRSAVTPTGDPCHRGVGVR